MARRASRIVSKRPQRASGDVWIFLIAVFKLVKGLALLIAGVGLLKLFHKDVAATAEHWIEVLRIDPDNRYVHRALLRVFNVTPKQLKELSVGTFLYAGLFLTESFGLFSRKRWADYMVIITTGLLLPLEVYELYRHVTWQRCAVTAVNVLIVLYLVRRVRRG